jgi:hypothetical protein
MIEHEDVERCTCAQVKDPNGMCAGRYRLDENGIKVECLPSNQDQVQLIVMDGCYCDTAGTKCDAVYLVKTPKKNIIVSVELKSSDVEKGVEQLAEVRKRDDYQKLKRLFKEYVGFSQVIEKAFLVSYEPLSNSDIMNFHKIYKIHVNAIVCEKGKGRITDLRVQL